MRAICFVCILLYLHMRVRVKMVPSWKAWDVLYYNFMRGGAAERLFSPASGDHYIYTCRGERGLYSKGWTDACATFEQPLSSP